MEPIEVLLGATEQDVATALKAASFGNWPQDDADLLEFFILMIDTKLGGTRLGGPETCMSDPEVNFRRLDH